MKSFEVTVGTEKVKVDFEKKNWDNGLNHFEFHGEPISETGYRSHFFYDTELNGKTVEQFAQELAIELNKELTKPKRTRKSKSIENPTAIDNKLYQFIYNRYKKANVDVQTFNFDRIDKNLTYMEQKTQAINILKELGIWKEELGKKEVEDEKEHLEQVQNLQYIQKIREEEQQAIEQIRNESNPAIERFFSGLNERIDILLEAKKINSLIIKSEAGMGKSFQVAEHLMSKGLLKGKDWDVISTFSSPLELYNTLYTYSVIKGYKVIVLDDVMGLLADIKNLGILFSATWSISDKIIVEYHSTTGKLEAPPVFEFQSKLIVLLNDLPQNAFIEGIKSRSIYYELGFNYYDKIKLFYEIAKKGYKELTKEECLKIADFISESTSQATQELNLRTLVKLFEYYLKYKNQNQLGKFETLAKEELKVNPIMARVEELVKSCSTINEATKKFIEEFGLSRATFFNYRRSLKV